MNKHQSFFICEKCGNIVAFVINENVPLSCCGQPMKELVANSTDAAGEKHVPVPEVSGDKVKIKVGSDPHPMVEEHLINWVYIKTENGGQRKNLTAGMAPEVTFALVDDKALSVYAYCNLHGLWMADI